MKRKVSKRGSVTRFDQVRSLSGRLLDDKDLILIAVELDGELDWWSVVTDLQSALDELALYYRIDWRGSGRPSLKATVFQATGSHSLNLD